MNHPTPMQSFHRWMLGRVSTPIHPHLQTRRFGRRLISSAWAWLTICALAALTLPVRAATSLITNGNFETSTAVGSVTLPPGGPWPALAGWTIVAKVYIAVGTTYWPNNSTRWINLTDFQGNGSMEQSFATTLGKTYKASMRTFNGGLIYPGAALATSTAFTVSATGNSALTVINAPGQEKTVTYEFTAIGATSTLRIADASGYASNAGWIDDVTVEELDITKAAASVTLGSLSGFFDGSPKPATATTGPAGLRVIITYNGSTTVPIDVGSYAVVATVIDASYAGSASGTLNILEPLPSIITNGDFETSTAVGQVTLDPGSTALDGWTILAKVTIAARGTTYWPNNSTRWINLNDWHGYGSIEQSFATTLGKTYQASMRTFNGGLVYSESPGPTSTAFTVSATGNSPLTVMNTPGQEKTATYQFTAIGTTTTLRITDASGYASNAGWIDDVKVEEVAPTATPPVVTSSDSAGGIFGAAFSYQITAANSPTSYGATGLPSGLSVSTTTGLISGTVTTAGTYTFTVSATNASGTGTRTVTLTIAKATATLTLANLNQTYDGSAKTVAVTTSPAGLSGVTLTYDGSPTVPMNAGTYPVVASLSNANYSASDASGTLTIGKAEPVITTSAPPDVTYGTALGAAQLNATANVPGAFVYTPASGMVLNAGPNQSLSVVFTPNDSANYNNAAATVSINVQTAALIVTAGNATRTYGLANNPAFTGTITGVVNSDNITATYSTTATASSDVGAYLITPALVDPSGKLSNYTVTSNNGTLTIAKAAATLALGNVNKTYDGSAKTVDVTTSPAGLSGVTLTYAGSPAAPMNAGSYPVVASLNNANYSAPDASGTLIIAKAAAGVTIETQAARYITVNTGSDSVRGTFTVELWVKPSIAAPSTVLGLLGSRTPSEFGFDLKLQNGNLIHADLGSGWGWITTAADASFTYQADVWMHIAYVVDHQEFNYKIYVNGSLAGDGLFNPTADPLLFDSVHQLRIGGTGFPGEEMQGAIDEVRIWGIARTRAQIEDNKGIKLVVGDEPGLVGYWRMDEGSGATIADSSARGHTGALVGTPVWNPSNGPFADAAASVLFGPITHTYDGSTKSAIASTVPAGLSVSFTYDGSATTPINAGSYAVVGTINNPNYAGSATGTLTIAKAAATVNLGSLAQTYDGTPKPATATTVPANLTVNFTYDGFASPPTAVGSYAVVATVNDANYAGSASGTLTIAQASATVTLDGLAQSYDATPKRVFASTVPANLTVNFTYDGFASPPTAPGSYAVVATVNDANHAGSASGTLTIVNYRLPGGAVSWWRGEDNANDSVGMSPGTILNGATFTVGKVGQAFSFDGVNDYVNVPAPVRSFGKQITVEYWINLTSAQIGSGLSQGTAGVDDLSTIVWMMHLNPDGSLTWAVNDSGAVRLVGIATPLTGAWHHIAGVADEISTRIYLDGALVGSGAGIASRILYNPSSVIHIGKDVRYPTGRFMKGALDEATIYNRALTGSEIQTIYNAAAAGKIPKASASLTLGGLAQTYDGTPKPATATTVPANLTVNFTYDGFASPPTAVGSYAVVATVNDANYAGSASDTLSIAQATPVITWSAPPAITYGAALGAAQLNATANAPGAFVYTPASGTVLNAGANQTLSVAFTPNDPANYNSAAATVSISVGTAPLTVTANDATRTYGSSNPAFTGTIVGVVNSDNITATYSTLATAASNIGAYLITSTLVDPSGKLSNYSVTSKKGTLTIAKAAASVTLGSLKQDDDGTTKSATATTVPPGLTVSFTYTYNGDPATTSFPQNPGSYSVLGTVNEANYTGSASGTLTIAIPVSASVVAWGDNVYGQTTVPAGLSGVTAIAAGIYHTVALKSDGTVVAWGSSASGQTRVPTGLSGVTAIAAGGAHTVALKSDGTVVAWGSNASGQTRVPTGLSGVTAIAAGGAHTVALVPSPILNPINPAEGLGGTGFNLSLQGSGFTRHSVVRWNDTPLTTTFVSGSPLVAQVPASLAPVPTEGIKTALITVVNPGGIASAARPFTIKASNVGPVQNKVAAAGQSVLVQTPPQPGLPGLTANFVNKSGGPASVTTARYTSIPKAAIGIRIKIGDSFVDLQISGADASDSATVQFYYPSPITVAAETALVLRYWNGFALANVKSSGGATPVKNTTDNLEFTYSGGRFTVLFDNTSTPKITELSGTIIALTVNEAPVAQADAATVAAGAVLAIGAPGVLGNDTDLEDDSLDAVLVSEASHGQVTLQPDGSFTYTPEANYTGPDSFSYLAFDGNADSEIVTVAITVTPANTPPIIVNLTGAYGTAFSYTIPANAFGDAGTSPTFSLAASGLPPGIALNAATRTLSGTPTAAGVFLAQVTATDNAALPPWSATAPFTFTVARAPLIVTANDAARDFGAADPPFSGTLMGVLNDDQISATYSTSATESSPAGTYPIIPDLLDPEGKLGNYIVTENNGTLTVNPVNTAPLAEDQFVRTAEDTAVNITLTGADLETATASLNFAVTAPPAHGALSGTAPNLTYTPAANYHGPDSFSFTVRDTGNGSAAALTSAPAVVHITITPVNDAPVAQCKNVVVSAGSNCSAQAVVDNGSHDIDDGDTITLTQTPAGPYPLGVTQVTLTVTDNHGASSSCTSTVTVIDTEAPKIAALASSQTVECDGAGNAAALNAWLASHGGAVATDNCGGVTWSHNFTALSDGCGATGSATVTFTATDSSGNSSITTATFVIVDTTAPVLTSNVRDILPKDAPISFTVSSQDTCGSVTLGMSARPYAINSAGKEIDKSGSTVIKISGNQLTIVDSGGVGTIIEITATGTDDCGNKATTKFLVKVLQPANEGVGNGVDGNTPGDANNGGNDSPGTAPGNPGAKNKK